jgi:hypothetical protein
LAIKPNRLDARRPMAYPMPMTTLLEKALSQPQNLSDREQDAVASLILDELKSEQAWDASFASSQSSLSHLAEQAVTDYKSARP